MNHYWEQGKFTSKTKPLRCKHCGYQASTPEDRKRHVESCLMNPKAKTLPSRKIEFRG